MALYAQNGPLQIKHQPSMGMSNFSTMLLPYDTSYTYAAAKTMNNSKHINTHETLNGSVSDDTKKVAFHFGKFDEASTMSRSLAGTKDINQSITFDDDQAAALQSKTSRQEMHRGTIYAHQARTGRRRLSSYDDAANSKTTLLSLPPIKTREQHIDQQIEKMQMRKGKTLLESVGRKDEGYIKQCSKAKIADKNRHTYVWDDYSYEVPSQRRRPHLNWLSDETLKKCSPGDERENLKEETARKMSCDKNFIERMMLEPRHPYFGGSKANETREATRRGAEFGGRKSISTVSEPLGFSGMGAYSGVQPRRGKFMGVIYSHATTGDPSSDKMPCKVILNPIIGGSLGDDAAAKRQGKRHHVWSQVL